MKKADLHVHSKYSSDPADLLLKKFGTQESYTEIEDIYRQAKARGMDFVTVTDHNVAEGSFKLALKYPHEAFTGVELTTLFPEDGCAVHVLVYGFNAEQFRELSRLRPNIYQLRDYIRAEKLAYSVAHASYSVNGKLSLSHFEKLIVLFDVFEAVNGARVASYNALLKKVLRSLTPEKFKELQTRHGLTSFSDTSWRKAFTGGSDEHAGLFIGDTFTSADVMDKESFLEALRSKHTDSGGRSNHYKTQVYTFLKIAYEFSQARHGKRSLRIWDELCAAVFDGKPLGWKTKLKISHLKRSRKEKNRAVAHQMDALVKRLVDDSRLTHQGRIDLIYNAMAAIEDAFFIVNAEAFKEALHKGDILKLISAMTAVFRSLFLSLPFLGTFRHLHQSSALMEEVRLKFLGPLRPEEKKILWFSDTLSDLNGVSVTLNSFAREAGKKGWTIRLATPRIDGVEASSNEVALPVVFDHTPEFYANYTLRFPSLLKSLECIYEESPTEIIISTPGPAGLIGILAARLFGIPCRGIYHSDFTRMTELGLSNGTMASFVQGYIRMFYGSMDETLVPSEETKKMLTMRGFDPARLSIFRRGIDTTMFAPLPESREVLRARFNLPPGITLLYAGRVSRDKSVLFLTEVYKELHARDMAVNLVIAGDGPLLEEIRQDLAPYPTVIFTGRVEQKKMPELYAMADLFVFPSTMDTFGMAVLEAQTCGLPALVTNIGGPQELISDGETGIILPADQLDVWAEAVERMAAIMACDPKSFDAMRSASRKRVLAKFGWNDALNDLFKGA